MRMRYIPKFLGVWENGEDCKNLCRGLEGVHMFFRGEGGVPSGQAGPQGTLLGPECRREHKITDNLKCK